MTLVQDWQRDIFSMVKFDEFLSNLKNCRIADIGKIETIVDKGARATVRLLDGSNRLLKAEVFGTSVRSGQFCLLIIPATPFDTAKNGLDVAERSYANTYAKCFPLQSPNFSSVQLKHDADRLAVTTPNYTLQCEDTGVSILDSNGFSIALKEGILTVANNDGSTDVSLDTEGIHINAGNAYSETGKEAKTTINIDNEGSISIASEGDISIDNEGSISIASEGDISIASEGEMSMKCTSLKIESDVEITGNFKAADSNLTAEA